MKLRFGNTLALVILLLAAVFLAAYVLLNYERVPHEVDLGLSGEARSNDLLALARTLDALGYSTKSHAMLPDMPPPGATLLLPGSRQEMSREVRQALLRWVNAGGHLIVLAQQGYESEQDEDEEEADDTPLRDALLDPLGVRKLASTADNTVLREWRSKPRPLQLHGETVLARFPQPFHLEDRHGRARLVAPQQYPQLLQYAQGAGRITALTDYRFLTNGQLKEHDHAVLAWLLLQPAQSKTVWLVYDAAMPGLLVWLWQRMAEFIIASGVLLLVWLWWRGSRLGPLLPDPAPRRRRLLDHIEASGRFLWRHGERRALLTAVRDATYRVLELRHPAWAHLPSEKLFQNLAELTRLPIADIRNAWLLDAPDHPHEFTHCVYVFEQIRKQL